jgi:TPP-dependent pyruvate/acetoin dehydrogenase alpha subunit
LTSTEGASDLDRERLVARLVTDGPLTPEEAERIAAAAREEMQAAVDFGLESPFPEPEAAVNHVYA